jgi:hypothetical protein
VGGRLPAPARAFKIIAPELKNPRNKELLHHLPLEVDAVRAMPGHGFHPLKARQDRSIP